MQLVYVNVRAGLPGYPYPAHGSSFSHRSDNSLKTREPKEPPFPSLPPNEGGEPSADGGRSSPPCGCLPRHEGLSPQGRFLLRDICTNRFLSGFRFIECYCILKIFKCILLTSRIPARESPRSPVERVISAFAYFGRNQSRCLSRHERQGKLF